MTRHLLLASALAVTLCLTSRAQAQPASPNSPTGAEVKVVLADPQRPITVRGELLAIDSTQVWLLVDHRTATFERAKVVRLDVRAHKFGGLRGFIGGLVGGVATGIGMAAACGAIDDPSGCGGFVAAWEAVWLLVTGISAAFMERNSWDRLPLTSWSRIADYARYPQGAPPAMTVPPAAGH